MNRSVDFRRAGALICFVALAACGGGGSSPSGPPAPTVAPPPVAAPTTPMPALASTSGTVYDLPYDGTPRAPGYFVAGGATGAAIAGADVYVGKSLVLGTTPPTMVPPLFGHAHTGADGSFTISGLAPGTYALTIFAPAPHVAVIHRDLIVPNGDGSTAYALAAPTPDETAWLARQNADRAMFGVSPLSLDEAAFEAARYWASFMARNTYFAHCVPASYCETGDTTPSPTTFGPQDVDPAHRFTYFHGFSGASEGENIAAGFPDWMQVDSAFMSEQSLCPHSSPVNCPFTSATGHFLNIVDPQYAWTGVAIATAASGSPYFDEEFTLVQTTLHANARVRALHPDVPGRRP